MTYRRKSDLNFLRPDTSLREPRARKVEAERRKSSRCRRKRNSQHQEGRCRCEFRRHPDCCRRRCRDCRRWSPQSLQGRFDRGLQSRLPVHPCPNPRGRAHSLRMKIMKGSSTKGRSASASTVEVVGRPELSVFTPAIVEGLRHLAGQFQNQLRIAASEVVGFVAIDAARS